MLLVVKEKFKQHPDLAAKLVDTGITPIIMRSPDAFWGCGLDGNGENRLGNFLQFVRGIHQADRPLPPFDPNSAVVVWKDPVKVEKPAEEWVPAPFAPVVSRLDRRVALSTAGSISVKLCSKGMDAEIAKMVEDLYECSKKVVAEFGEGSQNKLAGIIMMKIEKDPQSYAGFVESLAKAVESLAQID